MAIPMSKWLQPFSLVNVARRIFTIIHTYKKTKNQNALGFGTCTI